MALFFFHPGISLNPAPCVRAGIVQQSQAGRARTGLIGSKLTYRGSALAPPEYSESEGGQHCSGVALQLAVGRECAEDKPETDDWQSHGVDQEPAERLPAFTFVHPSFFVVHGDRNLTLRARRLHFPNWNRACQPSPCLSAKTPSARRNLLSAVA